MNLENDGDLSNDEMMSADGGEEGESEEAKESEGSMHGHEDADQGENEA